MKTAEPMIQELRESEIDKPMAEMIAKLVCRSFQSPKTVEDRIQEVLDHSTRPADEFETTRRVLRFDDNKNLVAHAKTFIRKVNTDTGLLPVLALATVCSDPDYRGHGLGAEVTLEAFKKVGQDSWPLVSLFQTPVPAFYEKLNCRIVENKFVDRTNESNPEAFPWRDDTVMIYPIEFDWPEGTIDINGPDY